MNTTNFYKKNGSFVILALFILSTATLFSQEVYQCEIGIDSDNTHVVKDSDGKYTLRSVIHHPNRGNDDDARDVRISVQLPLSSSLVGDISVEMTDPNASFAILSNYSHPTYSNFYTINITHLARAEHVDLKLRFSNPCSDNQNRKILLAVWPSAPIDIAPENNVWTGIINCNGTGSRYTFPTHWQDLIPNQRPMPIDEICKYVIDCPGCGFNVLCAGDIIQVPQYMDLNKVDLLYQNKIVATSALNKKAKIFELQIPEAISKKDAKFFTLVFK